MIGMLLTAQVWPISNYPCIRLEYLRKTTKTLRQNMRFIRRDSNRLLWTANQECHRCANQLRDTFLGTTVFLSFILSS